MLNEFLSQRSGDAGGAAVRADLGSGQALGQLALRLGTRPGPRKDGSNRSGGTETSSSIPQRQDGRELRHLLLNKIIKSVIAVFIRRQLTHAAGGLDAALSGVGEAPVCCFAMHVSGRSQRDM